MSALSKFVNCICFFLVPDLKIFVSFFIMSNDSITAKFIAKFIGIRLSHGYSIKELVNPIIKEFRLISLLTKSSASSFFRYHSSISIEKIAVKKTINPLSTKSILTLIFSSQHASRGQRFTHKIAT